LSLGQSHGKVFLRGVPLHCSILNGESILARKTTSRDASADKTQPQTSEPESTVAQSAKSTASDAPAPPEPDIVSEPVTADEKRESAPADSAQTAPPAESAPVSDAKAGKVAKEGAAEMPPKALAETAASTEVPEPATTIADNTAPDATYPQSATDAPPPVGEITPPQQSEPGQTPASSAPTSAPTSAPAQKSGIFPLILGGILAGGLGYGAHFLTGDSTGPTPELDALRSEVAALRAALPAMAPIEAELADLRAQMEALAVPQLDASDLEALAAQLRAEVVQPDAPADLEPLQAALAATQTRMDALEADLAELRDLALRRVAEAEAAIDAALATAGIDSLRAALETGAPYPDAVARLRDAGVAVPDVFTASATSGIATLEALQDGFADAARAALRVALQDAPAETTTDRLGNFLRAQIGARSTTPREGDDADAILSRAAAALERGELDMALSEIAALPDPAQAAMGDWLARAQARSAAIAALPDLATAITPE
jgi:hypothetical protein